MSAHPTPQTRRATPADVPAVLDLDHATGGTLTVDDATAWTSTGALRVAGTAGDVVGFAVVVRHFFGHDLVELVKVAPAARRRGVATALLAHASGTRATPKVFTSTNLSNRPMQAVLDAAGWACVGVVDGLDEGDPEVFYAAPPVTADPVPLPPVPGRVPARERTVHVVTHPEATHHVDGLVGGQFDSDLTPLGERQAAAIGAALRARITAGAGVAVASSDLLRTRRTAEVVASALAVTPTFDARLREKSYGEAGGRPQAWLDARFVPPPAVGDRLRHDEGVPGAETRLDLAVRAYAALTDLLTLDVDHLVVVTHGFTAGLLVAAWIGMPVASAGHVAFPVPSGSITTLREDGFFHNRAVVTVGDVAHLHTPAPRP
ncbi:GNAT family N-acetyltransferase [Cellulomonas iranensis]|uniref:GNAT family N-acetyltransferase n=1 Tax=Cellulomonas iranensis TaxID=76862 RepID=UPI003D7CEF49